MTYITTLLKGQYPELSLLMKQLHEDERGDNENLGRLLILALILIPMVILIAVFGDEIVKKAKTQWTAIIGKEVKQPT